MKQKLLKTWLTMLCLLVIGAGNAWAEEVVYKTALFGNSYNSEGVNGYSNSWSATNDGFTVNLKNWNNYNNNWNYIKAGAKNTAYVGTITTATAIDKAVTKIVVTIDAITAKNINSIKLYSGNSSNDCTTVLATFDKSVGAKSVTISSPTANKFYKLSFDCKAADNGSVQVSKIEYYYDNSASGSGDGDGPSGNEKWKLVTSAPTSWEGQYIIVAKPDAGSRVLLNGAQTGFSSITPLTLKTTDFSESDGILTISTDVDPSFTVTESSTTGQYNIKGSSGTWLGGTSGDASFTNNQTNWVFEPKSDGKIWIRVYAESMSRAILYRNTPTFQHYATNNENNTGYGSVYLYKKYESDGPTKTTPTLSFSPATYNYTMGETFSAPELNNPQGVTVSYSSSVTSVADFEEGELTIKAPGTTTITASFAGNETYNPNSASYELVVAPAVQKHTISYATTENGTIVVKNGETTLAEGAEVAEGTKLTIECAPTDAENYKFKNWQYKVDEGSWTTKYSATQDFDMPTGNTQFRANFELIPTYTIAWSVNGVIVKTDENVKQGTALNAPEVSAINGKNFTGWVTTPTVDADAAPSYVTPATPNTAEPKEITYYAVFADGEGGGNATSISSYADGKYILVDVYDNKYYAMNGEVSSKKISATEITSAVTTNADGSISIDLANAVIANTMKYDITHDNSEYVIKYGENKIYLEAKGNNLSYDATSGKEPDIVDNFGWTGFVEGTDDKARRFSITTSGTNSNGNATNNCLLMQASSWDSKAQVQSPTIIFKGYTQSNRGSITEKAQCYASGYMWFVPAEGGSNYSNFTTAPLGTGTIKVSTGGYDTPTEAYYATYYTDHCVTVPEGCEAASVNVEDNKMCLSYTWTAGKVIPANTGVVIKANAAKTYTYHIGAEGDATNVERTNYLYGSTILGTTVAPETGDYKFYKLAKATDSAVIGFYWGAADGAAFSTGANKAYLAVPAAMVANIKGFAFSDADDATAIFDLANDDNTEQTIYNLNGQRVSKAQRGIYIVNGKKVMFK